MIYDEKDDPILQVSNPEPSMSTKPQIKEDVFDTLLTMLVICDLAHELMIVYPDYLCQQV